MAEQLVMALHRHGGAREGAGRPRSKTSGIPHVTRPTLTGREPLLVTLKLVEGLASLRSARVLQRVLTGLMQAKDRLGMRIVHFSVQSDHLHLIVEAASKRMLSRAMKAFAVPLARAVNGVLGRRGTVLADRYHARVLTSPRQTRNAIAYVLCNARKHGHAPNLRGWLDRCSSASWFDRWAPGGLTGEGIERAGPAPAPARTWLLRLGWRRGGLLDPDHRPGALPS